MDVFSLLNLPTCVGFEDLARLDADGRIVPFDAPDSAPSPEACVMAEQRAERLRAAIAQLPHRQRTLIELHYLQELPVPEIARRLKCELWCAYGLQRSALARLRVLYARGTPARRCIVVPAMQAAAAVYSRTNGDSAVVGVTMRVICTLNVNDSGPVRVEADSMSVAESALVAVFHALAPTNGSNAHATTSATAEPSPAKKSGSRNGRGWSPARRAAFEASRAAVAE